MTQKWSRRVILIVAAFAAATAAHAGWDHHAEEDPFNSGPNRIAATSEGKFLTGFRCSSKDDVSLLFVTPQKPDAETTEFLASASIFLLVIIDDGQKISIPATLSTTADGEGYLLMSDDPAVTTIAVAASKATKRFAVAAEINNKIAVSKSFRLSGSTAAIGELLKGCKIMDDRASAQKDEKRGK